MAEAVPADVAAAAAATAAAGEKKQRQKPKVSKAAGGKRRSSDKHPSFISMVLTAITELKNPNGSSIPAILGFVRANYDVSGLPERSLRTWLRTTVHRGIASGHLKTDRGHRNSYHATPEGRSLLEKKMMTPASSSPSAVVKKKREKKQVVEEVAAAKKKKTTTTTKRKTKDLPDAKKPAAAKRAKPAADVAEKKKPPRKKEKAAAPPPPAAAPVKEIKEGPAVAADVMLTGVAFNTTDIPEVRADVGSIIKTLLQDDNTAVGIVANRGMSGEPGQPYKLETLDFTTEREKINAFIEGSYGEGSDWLEYYRAVLTSALNLPWAQCRKKYLFLVGNNGTSVLTDRSLQDVTGRLEMLGVRVFGFHHSQLDLLQALISDLH